MEHHHRQMSRLVKAAALVAVFLLAGCGGSPATLTLPEDPVIAAAGDIACASGSVKDATHCHQAETAALLAGADVVLPLGDNQYNSGTLTEYRASYDPSWGKYRTVSKPVPGNHEGSSKAGYRSYFGFPSTGPLYYSYDVGSWHVVAVDSDQCARTGCPAGSAQEQWVRQDLAAHPTQCTLAYWHQARWASGTTLTDNTYMGPIYTAMYEAGVDLVLNGHNHAYERFYPMTPAGVRDDSRGIRQIIVGTGGANFSGGTPLRANSVLRHNQTFGVLKVTLGAGAYDWRFVPEVGKSFTDSGSASCH